MAYTAPTVSASSQTHANLLARGVKGFVQALVAAQSAETAAQVTLTNQLLYKNQIHLVIERLEDIVEAYTHGDPLAIADVKAALVDLQFAYLAMATAIGEIGVLVDANVGTLTTVATGIGRKSIRTFP